MEQISIRIGVKNWEFLCVQSKDKETDELISEDKVNQEENGQEETDGMIAGDAYLKQQLMICNEENVDGLVRVTTDEERVLRVDWTETKSCADSQVGWFWELCVPLIRV